MSQQEIHPAGGPLAKVLIVDDDRLAVELLKDALEEAGYPVVSFYGAHDALAELDRAPVDLIVSDIDMPGLTGIQFLAAIRAREIRTPVIFLTGNEQLGTAIQAIRLGACDYIQKSKEAGQTLLIAIERALDRLRLEQENARLMETLREQNVRLERFNEELEERVRSATEELATANLLLQKGVQELSTLYEVSQSLSSTLEPGELFDLIMKMSREAVGAEACSLMLMSEDGEELTFAVAQGKAGDTVKKLTVKVGEGIAGWVAQKGEALLIPDAYEDPRFNRGYDQKTGFRTRSIMCAPLVTQKRIEGVVQIINRKDGGAFTQDDLEMLKAIAAQAAIALENAKLLASTRTMADDLREALERERWIAIEKEKMGRYVPSHLVDEIHRNREAKLALGGHVMDATILFSDIAGFTTMSEKVSPTIVIQYLNRYMTQMVSLIEEHGGILDKFMGDGIMAVFKSEEGRENHALAAVSAAIAMQLEVRKLSADWDRDGLGQLGVRIGINTGKVLSGNVGSETRMDYTVIGDNVNLAARLETNSRAGEILIHDTTYERVKDRLPVTPIKNLPIQVKGKAQSVQTYSILPPQE